MNEGKVKRQRSILFALVFLISMVVMATSAVFTVLLVHYRTKDLIELEDSKLFTAAELMQEMLGPGYHDRIADERSVSKEQFSRIVARNDELCRRLKLQYLWSVLVVGNRVVFTSATHSDLDNPDSPCASFFERHNDPQSFATALQPGLKPAFSSFKNEWGQGRQVLIPRKDIHGRTYIFGASVQMTELDAMVRRTALFSIGLGLGIICGAILLALKLAYSFSVPITRLTEAAGRMASGDFDVPLERAGTLEIQSLSESLHRMRQDTRRQMSDLQKSEELLRATFSATADGILVVDKEGRISHANAQFARMWRIPQDLLDTGDDEKVMGFALDQLADPDSFLSRVNELYQSSREDMDEIRFKDGRVFERFSCPVVSEGEEVGRIWDFRDITERKRADETLLEKTTELSRFFDVTLDLLCIADTEGRFLRLNKAWERTLGYTIEELMPGKFFDLIHPDDIESTSAVVAALASQREVIGFVNRYRCKDGSYRWIEWRSVPAGKLIYAAAQDITERRMAENVIRESEKKFSSMFKLSPEIVTISRIADGTLLDVNEAYEKQLGFSKEESIGHSALALGLWARPEDRSRLVRAFLEQDGQVHQFEADLRRKDGNTITVLLSAAPIEIKGESLLMLIATDITGRKLAEEKIRISEQRLKRSQEIGHVASWEYDLKTGKIWASEEGFRIYGIEPCTGELPIDKVEACIPESERVHQALIDLIERGKKYDLVFAINPEGGNRQTIITSIAELERDEQGNPVKVIGVIQDVTSWKQAEDEVRRSEERYRSLVEAQTEFICRFKPDGTFDYVNEAYQRYFGKTEEELIGHSWTPAVHPDDRGMVQAMLSRMSPANPVAVIENRVISKTGEVNWVQFVNQGFYDQDGNLVEVQSVGRDVTERKRMEELLKRSEEKFSKAFQASPAAITIASLEDGTYLEINDLFTKTTGYQRSEVIGHTSTELGVWVEVSERERYIGDLVRDGFLRDFETQYRMRNGEVRSFSVSSEIIQLGGKIYSLNFITDITERKLAEKELFKLASAIDQAAECVVITDSEGNIQYVNPAFERVTGFTSHEVVGQNPRILRSGVQDEDFYKNLWVAITRGDTWSGRLVNRRKNGTLYHEEASISPIRDKSGAIVNFVAVKKDITKEVELETQLLQSQKMEAIGQLAGGVAHDLNNLLTPILGYSEILLEGLHEGDARRNDILQIQQAAESAKTLTRQLLAFSRKQVLQMKPVDLGKVVRDFRKILRRTIREDIDIRIQSDASGEYVRADIGQIEQIIMNLSVNAQDAMPRGGILTLATHATPLDDEFMTAHPEASQDTYVLLEVSDTGKGMDSELMEHIFEPFFTTKDKSKGTGLGLSTVYGIVKQHSGFINVSSELGKGAIFRIYLPRIQDESGMWEERAEKENIQEEVGGSETILVVEDNGTVRELVCSILRKRGYVVICARDGQECLEVLADYDEHIDLLLTDVIMPDMNGKELHDNLVLTRPGLPVIFMSGYSDDAISLHGVLAEGVDLIHKPFTRKALTGKVREVLDRSACADRMPA